MDAAAWIPLMVIGLGLPVALVYLLGSVPVSAAKSLPTRPVWMVLLDGGTSGREQADDSDGGPEDGSDRRPLLWPPGGHEIACGARGATTAPGKRCTR
jgi:hypothetical protein